MAAPWQDFEKWMGNVDTGSTAGGMSMFLPVDIIQDADTYTFTADLPGVSKADTKVRTLWRHWRRHHTLLCCAVWSTAAAYVSHACLCQRLPRCHVLCMRRSTYCLA